MVLTLLAEITQKKRMHNIHSIPKQREKGELEYEKEEFDNFITIYLYKV